MNDYWERLLDAMNAAYSYGEDDKPILPFYDDVEVFWKPFAKKVSMHLALEHPFVFCPYCGTRLAVAFFGHTCGLSDID